MAASIENEWAVLVDVCFYCQSIVDGSVMCFIPPRTKAAFEP